MYKLNSGFRWTSSEDSESKAVTLSFPQQHPDSNIEDKKNEHSRTEDVIRIHGEQQLKNVISNLLKYGVLLATAVVLFGGIVYLINHGTEFPEYDYFHGEPSQFHSPSGIFEAAFSHSKTLTELQSFFLPNAPQTDILPVVDFPEGMRERAIIQFGLLLLIATPIIRVIISFLYFLRMRDFTYVIITFFVLSALTYSLVAAYY
jgi:uncharacterized membrane protein